MELFLSKKCISLIGSIDKSTGYSIRHRGKRFFGMRSPKGFVPPDGHLRFIIDCTKLAQMRTHIVDIYLTGHELCQACQEAKFPFFCPRETYNAKTIYDLFKNVKL